MAWALVRGDDEWFGIGLGRAAVDRAAPLTATTAFTVDYPAAIPAPSPNMWATPPGQTRDIRYVVIHDTESTCRSALNWLTNPLADASAHFLVCRDGTVYQLVRVADAAWHAGYPYINRHSIGIEHEGFAGGDYTPAQYRATADILHWVDARLRLHLQWTRNTVLGHENVPGTDHLDPGPGWDWSYFMSLLRRGTPYDGGDARLAVVMVARANVRACASTGCAILGTANWGEQFAVRTRRDGWVGIDFAGYHGWIYEPLTARGEGTIVHITAQHTVVRISPEAKGVPVALVDPGEMYASTVADDGTDHHWWWLIEFGRRYGFVCSCDTEPVFQPTPTATVTPRATPTATATNTPSPTPMATNTPSPTPMATNTPRPRPTQTAAPRPARTPRPRPTRTATRTSTPRPTRTPRSYPTHTPRSYPTHTPRSYPTHTPWPRPTRTTTIRPTHTPRPRPTRTAITWPTRTATPRPAATAALTATPTAQATGTATPTAQATGAAAPTETSTAGLAPTEPALFTRLSLRPRGAPARRRHAGAGATPTRVFAPRNGPTHGRE